MVECTSSTQNEYNGGWTLVMDSFTLKSVYIQSKLDIIVVWGAFGGDEAG